MTSSGDHIIWKAYGAVSAAKSALALGATEELREMLRACVADTVASAGNVANVETWTINLSVASVRAFLAATDAKGRA